MSFDQEKPIGELLDQALGEQLGLYFQPDWHPKHRLARRRQRRWRFALAGSAAAALFLALPFLVQPSQGQQQLSSHALSAIRLPKSLYHTIDSINHGSITVDSMVPVYDSYPLARPTGHNLKVSGHFSINGQSGNALSLELNNQMAIQGGMIFRDGSPVYTFSGSNLYGGQAIASPRAQAVQAVGKIRPTWYPGGDVAIGTFSAAGSHVYVTHGNLWSDVLSGENGLWMQSPGNPPATASDSIAGLPAHPNQALLTEENPDGLSQGFITTDGGTTWESWGLGTQSVSTLIAIGNRYWAIMNGTLAWSNNGTQWHSIVHLNPQRWQVETYAVDPANSDVAAVALIPISGDGIGPVLETHNGGKTWAEVPRFPAIGEAPSTMVMNTNGDIAALINANGPVVVRYSAAQGQWSVLPVPSGGDGNGGLGQLAATANGSLIYGAPGGLIYQWIRPSQQWLVIAPPAGLDNAGVAATPLQAIGPNQILAGYPTGWAYFVEPLSEALGKPAKPAASHNARVSSRTNRGTAP